MRFKKINSQLVPSFIYPRRLTTKGFRETLPNTKVHQQARQEEISGTIRVEGFSGM